MTRFTIIAAVVLMSGLSTSAMAGSQFAGGRAAPQWVNRAQAIEHYALTGVTPPVRTEASPTVTKLDTKGNFRITR